MKAENFSIPVSDPVPPLRRKAATTHPRRSAAETAVRTRAELITSRLERLRVRVRALGVFGGGGGCGHGEDGEEQSVGDVGELHGGGGFEFEFDESGDRSMYGGGWLGDGDGWMRLDVGSDEREGTDVPG